MPFQPGHKLGQGRPQGSGTGGQIKSWLLSEMQEILADGGPKAVKNRLAGLRDADLAQYLGIMVRMMPRDHNIDLAVNFEDRSKEDLLYFAENGYWPEVT